jgi:ABC-type Fe3+ transport system permease subunit
MPVTRWILAAARFLAFAILVAPVFGLLAAAGMDRGEDGAARPTVFPAALVAWDHLTRECLRNSLAIAGVATALSLLFGLPLASLASRGGGRFSGLKAVLVISPLAVPPFVAAWGWHLAVLWAAGRWPEWMGTDAGVFAAWLPMVAAYSVWGASLVASRAAVDLGRIAPDWRAAGQVAGSGRAGLALGLTWPLLRPGVARSLASVFTLTLIEPSAPWMLGLRRTLGYQALAESFRDMASPRLAALVVLATLVIWAVRIVLRRWGGEDVLVALPRHPRPASSGRLTRLASWTMAAGWAASGTLPLWFLVRQASGGISASRFAAESLTRPLAVSIVLGAIVATCGLLLAGRPGGPPRRGWAARLLSACPPLALAVGALALPGLLELATRRISGGSATLDTLMGPIARALDPLATPGLALALVTVAATFPAIAAIIGASRRPSPDDPIRLDAARLLGIPAREARKIVEGPRRRRIWLAGALLSTASPTAGLLLAPTTEARPLSTSFVLLVDRPGQAARIAEIGVTLTALNALGLILAGREGRRQLAGSPPA